jgi:predicted LPLAT superfamily acyltransferase
VAEWRHIPEAGTVLGLRALVLVVRIAGRRVAGWILFVVAFYYALRRVDARRASREYLRRVDQPATFWHVVRHLHTFAQVSLDSLFFMTGQLGAFEVEQKNHDRLVEAARTGRGVLLLGAHLGSFDVMRCRAKDFDIPINVVVDFSNAVRINSVLRSLAPDMNTRLISLADDPLAAMLEIKAAIGRGEVVAILADRLPEGRSGGDRVVKTRFLGDDVWLPAGPWLLAHALKCPVYFVAGLFTRPNRYALQFELLADEVRLERKERAVSLERYAQTYASTLDAFTRSAPLNWFNFFDFWSRRD